MRVFRVAVTYRLVLDDQYHRWYSVSGNDSRTRAIGDLRSRWTRVGESVRRRNVFYGEDEKLPSSGFA